MASVVCNDAGLRVGISIRHQCRSGWLAGRTISNSRRWRQTWWSVAEQGKLFGRVVAAAAAAVAAAVQKCADPEILKSAPVRRF